MKNKLTMLLAFLGLSVNVALAGNGSVGTGYASDFFRRGALLSAEAVQANASYGFQVFGLDSSVGVFTNQGVAEGSSDFYLIDLSASKSLGDLFDVSVGLEHSELNAGASALEVGVTLDINTALNPYLSLYRDLDETLYTVEAGVSHSIDLKVAQLNLLASYGQTESLGAADVDYNSLGASLTRSISDTADLTLSVGSVDSDSISREGLIGLGLSVKF